MADLSTLARPYAKAAFELARDGGRLKEWSEALNALAAAVKSPQLSGLIGHPALAKADLADVLAQSLGSMLGAQGQSLARLLVENNRLSAAPQVAEQFAVQRAEAESRVDVEITSATAVPTEQQQKLIDAISRRLARTVSVTWSVDADLLAGAVIRAGDLVIDGSVKGELEKLRTALTA